MKFNGTIVITDPCYIIKKTQECQNDWERCEYGERMEVLGITHYISESTIYGDWSCTTYSTNCTDVENQVEEISRICKKALEAAEEYGESSKEFTECKEKFDKITSSLERIGVFGADAGMVSVFLLDEVLIYNPDFFQEIKKHPWCVTVIPDFDGDVKYYIDEEGEAHIIGKGNINFLTFQTGL